MNTHDKIFETDWLASKPVFYNDKTGAVSHNIHEVIDYKHLEFHAEGFNNYLESGFSVFGQTPFKHVKFLESCMRITQKPDGALHIEQLPDPIYDWQHKITKPEEVLDIMRKQIREWQEKSQENPAAGQENSKVILPLSGGYDSRLLASLLPHKKNVLAFTYGISENQSDSREVIQAKAVAQKLGIEWEYIELNNIHAPLYFDQWDNQFGPVVHAHGMYHIDFYWKIRKEIQKERPVPLLSGIYGDLWAGAIGKTGISSPADLTKLSYAHGMTADPKKSLIHTDYAAPDSPRQNFWKKHHHEVNDEYFQLIMIARQKMILLSYLYSVPEAFGFRAWSPFLSPEIALGMLKLPPEIRKNRQWQKDFFMQAGIDIESENIKSDNGNTLNLQALRKQIPPPLDVNLLGEVMEKSYIEDINRILKNAPRTLLRKRILEKLKITGLLSKIGIKLERYNLYNAENKAYNSYLTLLPIQYALQRRNKERNT